MQNEKLIFFLSKFKIVFETDAVFLLTLQNYNLINVNLKSM